MQYSIMHIGLINPQVKWLASVEVGTFHTLSIIIYAPSLPRQSLPLSLQVGANVRWDQGVRTSCDVPDQYSLPPPLPPPPPFQEMIDAPSSWAFAIRPVDVDKF